MLKYTAFLLSVPLNGPSLLKQDEFWLAVNVVIVHQWEQIILKVIPTILLSRLWSCLCVFFSLCAPRDPVSPLFDCVLWVQVCLVNYPRLVLYIKCCLFLVSFVWCYVLHVSPACLVLPLFWTIKNCYPEFYYLSTRSLPPRTVAPW